MENSKNTKTILDKNYRGWEVIRFNVSLESPTHSTLNVYPLAYTDSGHGTGEIIYLNNSDSIYYLKDQLKGKIILLGESYRPAQHSFNLTLERLTPELLKQAEDNPDPNDLLIGYHSRRSTKSVFEFQEQRRKEKEKFFTFCKEQGVLALIEPSDYPNGILHADGNGEVPSYTKENDIRPVSSFAMSNEDFGRLMRLKDLDIKPTLSINLETKFYYSPDYNVNLIAEIEGSDPILKNEVVMIGAHLDSWHAGTGAVDNASGCAVMMEAMRLIKASGAKPKHTIRLALWGGEEQVFAGSSSYVEKNIGDLKSALPVRNSQEISAYFNLDNGAGKIRGIYLMGNDKVKPVLKNILEPFDGDNTLTLQNANQTDHELFDYQNIPAFQFIQDPLNYMSVVHHTNMDVMEYVPENDLKFNAVYVAYLALQVAQQDEMLPRKKFNSPLPSLKGNTTFELKGFTTAREVQLVGDFNNWNMFGTALKQTPSGWVCKIDLPKGDYVYKYIIDGNWTPDPSTSPDQLVKDGKGHAGLTIKKVN